MNQNELSWYAVNHAKGNVFVCASCRNSIDLEFASIDHNPRVCPACGIECLFWSAGNSNIQILPALAPPALRSAIEWAQTNLDELEFIELWVAIEELMEANKQGG